MMQWSELFKQRAVLAGLTITALVMAVGAKSLVDKPTNPRSGDTIESLTGVWVEGPGFDITYGGTYDNCAKRCLASAKCAMIEFYRPEKKCNLYGEMRPRKTGGSSEVGIRRANQGAERR